VTVLTLGPPEAEEQIRDCLAIGANRGILIETDGEEWDPQATAAAIAAEAAGYDLIIFGNESADAGNFQVGIRVAHALGRPVVTGLKGLSLADDGRLRCEQEVAGGRDVYLVPLPAVVSVLEGINLPRYPSVPAKLRARQKPIERRSPERPAAQLERLRLVVPAGQGKQAEILGRGPDAAPAVVEVMRELGVA
jgi:electron transfer flavoprotein beta subunit